MIRGEYNAERIRKLKEPLRRAWGRARDAMAGDGPGAPPPRELDPTLRGKLHRLGLGTVVIMVSAALAASLTIPAAMVAGRFTRGVASKFSGGPTGLQGVSLKIAQRSVVYGAGGDILATLTGEENRELVGLSRIPDITQKAVIAIEDSRFYQHHGVDMNGLARALFSNLEAGGVRQGGSTITQQLVKNIIVGKERTLDRKIREAQFAVALEREKSKREILELYLNEAYFGEGIYGIGTAAEFYFGKKVEDLTLAESALLAGTIRAPERYGPLADKEVAAERRTVVLDRMAELGYITREQAYAARREPITASSHPLPKPIEPYFLEFVKQQILDDSRFGETRGDRARALFQGGLRIETTLDLKLQKAAAEAVSKVLDKPNDPSAALVSVDPATGAVKAMVGGNDFENNKYNLAVQGSRQAGSSFKPFTMVAALESGIPPGYTLDTPSPVTITDPNGQVWPVENYDHNGEGFLDMRRATELSVNSYYAQLINKVGPQKVVDVAAKMGITSPLKPYLSLALGTFDVSPYEMASAYGTLANNGIHCKPFAITRVLDAAGKTILRNDPQCEQVLDPAIAAQADAILQGVIDRGTGRRNAKLGRPAAGKTGTTDNYTDAWFSGFVPQFATAVWLGYPESTEHKLHNIHGYPDVYGGSLPAMIWARFMKAAIAGVPATAFPPAPPVVTATVPDVVGQTSEDAVKALSAAGFSVRIVPVVSSLAPGVVAEQSPGSGAEVEAGSLVTLSVSDGSEAPPPEGGPTPEPTPDATPEKLGGLAAELRLHRRRDLRAVGPAAEPRHQDLHDLAHLLGRGGAGLGDRLGNQGRDLVL